MMMHLNFVVKFGVWGWREVDVIMQKKQ